VKQDGVSLRTAQVVARKTPFFENLQSPRSVQLQGAFAMSKRQREHNEDLEAALQSISDRWRGDLTSYLEALARAKEAVTQKEDDERSPVVPETARLTRVR
jgi:hypothetical protein